MASPQAPAASAETQVHRNIAYSGEAHPNLLMDVYRPSKLDAKRPLPVIILFNSGGPQRGDEFYVKWAKLAAVHGFVAISPGARSEHLAEDFDQLLAYLGAPEHAAQWNVDAGRIAVYAGSGNVSAALPLLEDPKRTQVKAGLIFYGVANVREFRPDLPLLYVRAGLDRPNLNRQIAELAANALQHNAPVTLLNYAGGHHAFELADDNEATREILEQSFQFLRSALSPRYQAAMRERIAEASAAGAVMAGDSARAAELYSALATAHPDDPQILLAYGEALVGAGRYKEARRQFDRLLPMHAVGARDLAVPAATACVLDHDPEAAIEWLKTVPKQFLPRRLMDDPAFQPLRDRAGFLALFQ